MLRHRVLVWLALAAAGFYAATGAIELTHDQPTVFADAIDYWLEGFFVAALAASTAVLAALVRTGGRMAAIGWGLAATGNAALLVAALATAVKGRETLDILFAVGFLAIVSGYLILAVLDAGRRLAPARAGLVLLVGFIGGAVFDGLMGGGGGLVFAAVWVALAGLVSGEFLTPPWPGLRPEPQTPQRRLTR
jgi:hypothetical protein